MAAITNATDYVFTWNFHENSVGRANRLLRVVRALNENSFIPREEIKLHVREKSFQKRFAVFNVTESAINENLQTHRKALASSHEIKKNVFKNALVNKLRLFSWCCSRCVSFLLHWSFENKKLEAQGQFPSLVRRVSRGLCQTRTRSMTLSQSSSCSNVSAWLANDPSPFCLLSTSDAFSESSASFFAFLANGELIFPLWLSVCKSQSRWLEEINLRS